MYKHKRRFIATLFSLLGCSLLEESHATDSRVRAKKGIREKEVVMKKWGRASERTRGTLRASGTESEKFKDGESGERAESKPTKCYFEVNIGLDSDGRSILLVYDTNTQPTEHVRHLKSRAASEALTSNNSFRSVSGRRCVRVT